MNSATLPSFWEAYGRLDDSVRQSARKAYALWANNPFHPSLRFKCVNRGGQHLVCESNGRLPGPWHSEG